MDAVASMVQSQHHHEDGIELSLELAGREISVIQRHHKEGKYQAVDHCDVSKRLKHKHHLEDRELDIKLAWRDGVRDSMTHRSAVTQAIMIVDALMIGCVFAMTYQFSPPVSSPPAALTAFSTFLAAALVFLTLSVTMSLQLQSRIMEYDLYNQIKTYRCGNQHDSFNNYFTCDCASLQYWSVKAFYAGGVSTICAAALLMGLIFELRFGATGPTVLWCCCCSGSVLLFIFGDLFVSDKTHEGDHYMGLTDPLWRNGEAGRLPSRRRSM